VYYSASFNSTWPSLSKTRKECYSLQSLSTVSVVKFSNREERHVICMWQWSSFKCCTGTPNFIPRTTFLLIEPACTSTRLISIYKARSAYRPTQRKISDVNHFAWPLEWQNQLEIEWHVELLFAWLNSDVADCDANQRSNQSITGEPPLEVAPTTVASAQMKNSRALNATI